MAESRPPRPCPEAPAGRPPLPPVGVTSRSASVPPFFRRRQHPAALEGYLGLAGARQRARSTHDPRSHPRSARSRGPRL